MDIFVLIMLYLAPAIIAYVRRHKHRQTIGIINIFFGWMGLPWIVCLVWSFLK